MRGFVRNNQFIPDCVASRGGVAAWLAAMALLFQALAAIASGQQIASQNRITQPVDNAQRATLSGIRSFSSS